jgi:toxin ParE1/3/4
MNAILDHIEGRSPKGAKSVKQRLQIAIDLLADHPQSGQATGRAGFRRFVVNPFPYVVVYQPTADAIIIHGVRYAARRPRG